MDLDVVLCYQCLKAWSPMMLRGDYVHEVQQNNAGVIDPPRIRNKLSIESYRLALGDLWGDRELSVPEPRMVSTQVSQVGEMVEPGLEDFFVYSVHGRYGPAGGHRFKRIVPAGKQAKRHDFADSPDGRQWLAVCYQHVLDENLV